MEGHTSVLLAEALESLEIDPSDTVVDGTLGGAGHFRALLEKLGPKGTLLGIDADHDAIARAEQVIAASNTKASVHLANDNFRNLAAILEENGIAGIDKSLFDLGWSGYQLANGKGFSFQKDEPLLMTYGDSGETAADVVNETSETELADIIYQFGEEQFSRRIAKAVVETRKKTPITTTAELVDVITRAVPAWYQRRKINPATKTFQALRIYVNDEFGALHDMLTAAIEATRPGGRIALITFHSSEDRIVKNRFRQAVADDLGTLYTKKPIVPSREEEIANPRARSAKLRVFIRA